MGSYPTGYGVGGYGVGGSIGGVPPRSYYLSLITSQYQLSPNFLLWLGAVLQVNADLATAISEMITPAFDLAWAVGAQLDILGQWVGVVRTVPFQPSGGVSPILDDPTYRILIIAKIGQNQWDGKIASLYPLWQALFPGGTIEIFDQAAGVMTADLILAGQFTSIIQDLIVNGMIVPRPEGVLYNYIFATLPIFGCDENNSFIAGADLGHTA